LNCGLKNALIIRNSNIKDLEMAIYKFWFKTFLAFCLIKTIEKNILGLGLVLHA
jgi:hypothetical protein